MKSAKNRVKIHTPYIICNDMMYNTWEEIGRECSKFFNHDKFGLQIMAIHSGLLIMQKNRNKILNTELSIWEYEGGYSYYGKSILIDGAIYL